MSSRARREATIESWATLLDKLPIPAALLNPDGTVMAGSRWLDTDPGESLIYPPNVAAAHMASSMAHDVPQDTDPKGDILSPGLHYGKTPDDRWRVRVLSVSEDEQVLLATRATDEAGTHVVNHFFSSGPWLFVAYDQWGKVVESNDAWSDVLGYSEAQLFGLDSWSLLSDEDVGKQPQVEEDLRNFGRSEPTFRMRAANGSYRTIRWLLHYSTELGRSFGLGHDVTREQELAAQLERQATIDELTGLPNRSLVRQKLDQWLSDGFRPTVLFCDLDHFKVINDSLGHRAGDELLATLGQRLSSLVQDDNTVVGRMGGDEFVAIAKSATAAEAEALGRRIIELTGEMFIVADQPAHIGVSVGISLGPRRTDLKPASPVTAEGLLEEADTAAYRAKQAGRNQISIFDAEMRSMADRRLTVEVGLRRALEEDRIEALYQPIVAVPGGTIVGVETLIRMRDEDGRLVTPNEFLDVAQEAGLLPSLGYRMLDKATELGGRLARFGRPLMVSVNISAVELSYGNFAERVRRALTDHDLVPEHLLLEITETAVLKTDATLPLLWDLQATGVRLGLDDFGTGFSSLAHLRELPIDVVKIDRSFVANLSNDGVTRELTASLVGLCEALALEVILEGVETAEQSDLIEQLGGRMAQGYLFHRPMTEEQLLDLLAVSRPREAAETAGDASPRTT